MATGVSLTPQEAEQLRALVAAAWPHRHGPKARAFAEAIVDWHHLRPIARGDLIATKRMARDVLAYQLERTPPPLTIDELARLCGPVRRLRVVA